MWGLQRDSWRRGVPTSYLSQPCSADLAALALPLLVVAAVATVVESLPINAQLDDNLSVPAVTWLLGLAILQPAQAAAAAAASTALASRGLAL